MGANKPADLTPLAARWLLDFNEAPWRRYLRSLEERGLLADVDGIRVDAGTIFKTHFRCDTKLCAGIDRSPGTESCCTDYDVEITPEEHARIVANADAVIELLSRHDGQRVTRGRGIAEFFEEAHTISLAKEKGRCAFSYREPGGQLRCGLHSLALEKGVSVASIKPLACVLFPIVIYRFENGETFLTATSRETSSLFGREKDSDLPCLRAEQGDPMFIECRMAIEAGFGEAFYQRLILAATEFEQTKRGPA
ncbi:MAG: DUF3109 family protein [Gammaproteobacteria bacterium]